MQTDTTTTRRRLLMAAPAVAVAVAIPSGAFAHPPQGDAAIQAAWNRRVEASRIYDALPFSDADGEPYTPEERVQWAIIDAAEEFIRSTVAKTPQGVVIQLWAQLSHNVTHRDDEAATRRRDLAYFEAMNEALDWTERLTIAAIRSLQGMEA